MLAQAVADLAKRVAGTSSPDISSAGKRPQSLSKLQGSEKQVVVPKSTKLTSCGSAGAPVDLEDLDDADLDN